MKRNFKEKIIGLDNGSYETLKTIGEVADTLHYPCYVVGGWVRDLLLAKKNDPSFFPSTVIPRIT